MSQNRQPRDEVLEAIANARYFNRIFGVYSALGVRSRADKDFTDATVAKRRLDKQIADLRHETTNIQSRLASSDIALAEQTLSDNESLAGKIGKKLEPGQNGYDRFDNRPYHILNGINMIFSQLDTHPIAPWRLITRRLAFRKSAETWRKLIIKERRQQRATKTTLAA